MNIRNFLSLALTLLTIAAFDAQANVLLEDDFSNGLSQWQIFGSPSPSIQTIIGPDGNPTQVFATNDDGNWGGFALSNETFNYVNTTFQVSVDVKHANFGGGYQKKSTVFLNKTNSINNSVPSGGYSWFLTAEIFGNSSAYGPSLAFGLITMDGSVESGRVALADGDGWHNLSFLIDTDGFVSFLVDNVAVYNSVGQITDDYDGTAALLLGHRRAFHDNVLVTSSVPAPATLLLFLAGIIGMFWNTQAKGSNRGYSVAT
ncbi:MAG: PEP-CTERM sorting domain-containing protein [Pseudomonadota bacterium]